ncbi:TetR/AcrR family transcriptional regulator [Nocardia sp. NPDC056952]|uniref:TetR/AcrR family transcriptional regulator n=1 Tax=Nocardia sp. NPDC056952 TaxID=3345979 RepID=UPI00363EA430
MNRRSNGPCSIYASPRRLAVEHGLDATNVDDIAKAVGVSPRTFFNYYETKLDAVVGPIGEIGTPEARREFVAGGPTGVLIEDLTRLHAAGVSSRKAKCARVSRWSRSW